MSLAFRLQARAALWVVAGLVDECLLCPTRGQTARGLPTRTQVAVVLPKNSNVMVRNPIATMFTATIPTYVVIAMRSFRRFESVLKCLLSKNGA
jgi:hypothetical protein